MILRCRFRASLLSQIINYFPALCIMNHKLFVMKRLSILCLLLLTGVIPMLCQGFNFAATIRGASGNFLTDRETGIRISILKDTADGEVTYIEEFKTRTNPFGVANVTVGEGAVVSGDFAMIDWGGKLFLKAEVSENNDGKFSLINITEIGSVPYSMHSNTANALTLTSDNGKLWDISVDDNGNLISSPRGEGTDLPEYGTVDYIFDENALPTITLEISTDEWNKLLTNFDINPHNEDCVVADFYFNKYGRIHKLEDIGLRLRGNTSRVRPEGSKGELHNPVSPDWHHCHFGFRFEKFRDDNLFSGTDRFSLRWAKEDPTYVHEIYSYDMLRRFGVWSTLKSSYCRLQIKIKEDNSTAYMGVYEMFEAPDKQYLADRMNAGLIKSDAGFMWKMGSGSGVGAYLTKEQANPALMGIEDIPLEGPASTFTYDYKGKKKKFEEARTQFLKFINDLNDKTGDDFIAWAEANINIELLLRSVAVTVAVGQWDDYWGNGNNFYLYFDSDGKCNYIPYDFDNALGTSIDGIMYNPGTGDPFNWGNPNRPLVTKILAVNKWREQYKGYLLELISASNDYLDAEKSIKRIKQWHGQIGDFVNNDTGEDCVIEDRTASWSSGIRNYRLLTGNDQGGANGDPNFFRTRVRVIKEACSK